MSRQRKAKATQQRTAKRQQRAHEREKAQRAKTAKVAAQPQTAHAYKSGKPSGGDYAGKVLKRATAKTRGQGKR